MYGIAHSVSTQHFQEKTFFLIFTKRAVQGVRNISFSQHFTNVINDWFLIIQNVFFPRISFQVFHNMKSLKRLYDSFWCVTNKLDKGLAPVSIIIFCVILFMEIQSTNFWHLKILWEEFLAVWKCKLKIWYICP